MRTDWILFFFCSRRYFACWCFSLIRVGLDFLDFCCRMFSLWDISSLDISGRYFIFVSGYCDIVFLYRIITCSVLFLFFGPCSMLSHLVQYIWDDILFSPLLCHRMLGDRMPLCQDSWSRPMTSLDCTSFFLFEKKFTLFFCCWFLLAHKNISGMICRW